MEPIRKTVSSVDRCRATQCLRPVSREERQRSVADQAQGQADRRPAVQNPIDTALYLKLIDVWHKEICLSPLVGDFVDS